jgi:hypothetical protein
MKLSKIIMCVLPAVFLTSCVTQKAGKKPTDLMKVKAEYDSLAKKMVESVTYIGEPLKGLNEEQLASVAALLVMTRVATQNEGIKAITSTTLSERFWVEVLEICPPTPKDIGSKLPGCLGLELESSESMATCMNSKCREYESEPEKCDELKWKYERICEKENAGKLTEAVQCRMEEIEKMRGILQRISGRKLPPGPFPWPELEGGAIRR